MPGYDPSKQYYEAYWDLYLQNEQLMSSVCSESLKRDEILTDILLIETFYEENLEKLSSQRYLHNGRKRHNRRCADEIQKGFTCPYEQCCKVYGSEGSLNLHIKLKHNGGNKTDREKIAKSLVYAKATGLNLPTEQLTAQLNLPPGIIYMAAEQAGITLDEVSLKKMEDELRR